MSLIKLAIDFKSVKNAVVSAAKGSAIKTEAKHLENSTLTAMRRMPTMGDKLKHFTTTKAGLKAVAPTAALYGGAAVATGGAASMLGNGKKND